MGTITRRMNGGWKSRSCQAPNNEAEVPCP